MRLRVPLAVLVGALLIAACEVRVGSRRSAGDAAEESPPVPDVPSGPASGTIAGREFVYEDASIDEGILELRRGEDFFADLEVTLFLFLDDKATVPEGRIWNIDCVSSWSAGVPHVHIGWRAEGKDIPEHKQAMCDYRLYLALGEETDRGTLPGGLVLSAPNLETEIAGRFEAEIEGFRIKDGEVDLTQDDLEVAHHLAAEWLSAENGAPVEIIDNGLGWLMLESPEGRLQSGYSVYWWKLESEGETHMSKLQFAKRDGAWKVERELEDWQVAQAHRISPRDDLMASLDQRAAQRFEEEHLSSHGRRPVFVTELRSSYNPKVGLAQVELRYLLDPERARERSMLGADDSEPLVRYLFRTSAAYPAYKEPEAWTLERRLEEGEEVDFKAGRVVARR